MALIFWGFVGWLMLLLLAAGAAPILAHSANRKEKERKLAMMREYPHLAGDILKSIEEQEARHQASMKDYSDGLGDAMTRARGDFHKAVTPKKPRHGAAIVRIGLGIARRLIK